MNKAIKCFGEKFIMKFISEFNKNYNDIPLVSIKSGNGCLEKKIEDDNIKKSDQLILIEQYPLLSSSIIFKPPKYNDIDSLIIENPFIIKNCNLLLNWCLPNESEFDYDAIINLKPIAFICIYETYFGENGAAGGEKFFNYIHSQNSDYELVHSTKGKNSGLLIEWYQRKDYIFSPNFNLPRNISLEKEFVEQCLIS